MTDLDKEIEEKIYDILKKYHKDEDYNLNYLITDDIVTFFLSINEGNLVTMEDLYKISGILNAKIEFGTSYFPNSSFLSKLIFNAEFFHNKLK